MVDPPTDLSHLSCHRSEIPALVSLEQVRQFTLIPNPKMNLMQPCSQERSVHPVPTIPVVALQKTNCFQNWQISLEPQEVRNCLSCRKYVSHFWVNRGCWPRTHSEEHPCWIDSECSLIWSLRNGKCWHPFDVTENVNRNFVRIPELLNFFRHFPHWIAGASF